ncbi:MAG: chloride channel protein [Clostridiales bacterium]|jgi:H+/Cl- antiporter ClcA|nr:chloride channel protein [Clostridiales bacterium]
METTARKSPKQQLIISALFAFGILKWAVLSCLVGAVIGLVCTGFILLLNLACDFTAQWEYYFVFLPAAMFLSAFLIKHLAPSAEGHGTEKAIEAIHLRSGRTKIGAVPIKAVTTIITISAGGSVGKEGPATQIGVGIAGFIATLIRLNDNDTKRLVICGMSAVFAAIFGTPVAAAILALEILVVGKLNLRHIFPILAAAVVSYFGSQSFGLNVEKLPSLGFALNVASDADRLLTAGNLLLALGAGVFFGLVALLTIFALKKAERLSQKIKLYKPLKGIIGGAALVGLTFLFGRQYLGLGTHYFTLVNNGQPAYYYDFLLKIVFTMITICFGGSGGLLTPIMFIGATAGSAFAGLFGLDSSVFACLGMFAVFAGATNTPLSCIIMALEMSANPSFAVMAAIACPVAYLITGHNSVYPTQLIPSSKISGVVIDAPEGHRDLEHVTERYQLSKWLTFVVGLFKKKSAPAAADADCKISVTEEENNDE